MNKMKKITTGFFMAVGLSTFANYSDHTDDYIITAKGVARACQGFCGGDFRTDEENLEDAKRFTDSRAKRECRDEEFKSAVLVGDYTCDVDKVLFYSIVTTCYGTYMCE